MSLPWSQPQREWLREMGFEVLARRGNDPAPGAESADAVVAAVPEPARPAAAPHRRVETTERRTPSMPDTVGTDVPPSWGRIAGGVDLLPLLAAHPPRDPASRRALWRVLRPLRKAARGG
jgi:hypothetical protein